MRLLDVAAVVAVLATSVACTGLDKKGSATVPTPGAANSGGAPDVTKSKGTLDLGGDMNLGGVPDLGKTNTGGKPDPNKSHGTIGETGPASSGGRPDVSKSIPKKK